MGPTNDSVIERNAATLTEAFNGAAATAVDVGADVTAAYKQMEVHTNRKHFILS